MKSVLFLAALTIGSPSLAESQRTFLVSVEGVQVGVKEYVASFSIDTWGVEIVATCQIPPGWTITAGSRADPTGKIAGEASLGVTFLDRTRLKYLKRIALLRTYGPIQKYTVRSPNIGMPATFAGTAVIGTYGTPEKTRIQKLDFRNLHLTPASRCPLPQP